jgi:hypothetical protein
MSWNPLQRADPSQILAALQRDCEPEQIVSVQFCSEIYPVRSLNEEDQWLRLKGILACEPVYNALGIFSLPIKIPGKFHHARGLETIGTLANLLMRGGVHAEFVGNVESAWTLSRSFFDNALHRRYAAEAYSCSDPWCEWFIGEGMLDETVLLGNGDDWWLLAVTGTD